MRCADRYRKALERAAARSRTVFDYYARTAGTGSLGRPRYFGVGAWQRRPDRARGEGDGPLGLGAGAWRLAQAALRRDRDRHVSRRPTRPIALRGSVLVRRLSPNDFKIEVE